MQNNNSLVKYPYKIYGLNVNSEVYMPELMKIDSEEMCTYDVNVYYGNVPNHIEDCATKKSIYDLSKHEFCLRIKGVASYYVANGNTIIVNPESECSVENIKVFLLGTCFGILLKQRNTIAIHGGTIAIDGQGIIITGHTGAGKSTLISAFRNEGYAFLADDVSALGIDIDKNVIVHPTYPQQKLCRDAMNKMGYDTSKFQVVDSYRNKYSIPSDINFHSSPVLLKAIYEINIGQSDFLEISEILGSEKIRLILRNIYRIDISNDLGFDTEYFKHCVDIAKLIPIYRIKRPKSSFSVNEQMKIIKDTLKVEKERAI